MQRFQSRKCQCFIVCSIWVNDPQGTLLQALNLGLFTSTFSRRFTTMVDLLTISYGWHCVIQLYVLQLFNIFTVSSHRVALRHPYFDSPFFLIEAPSFCYLSRIVCYILSSSLFSQYLIIVSYIIVQYRILMTLPISFVLHFNSHSRFLISSIRVPFGKVFSSKSGYYISPFTSLILISGTF